MEKILTFLAGLSMGFIMALILIITIALFAGVKLTY